MEPGLIDSAVLVSCPCDLVAWRAGRKAWTRSENPMDWAEKVPSTTRIVALTGSRDGNTIPDLAKRYVDALLLRNVPARFLEIPDTTHNEALSTKEVNETIAELIRSPGPSAPWGTVIQNGFAIHPFLLTLDAKHSLEIAPAHENGQREWINAQIGKID
jgi:hypothetical protein